MSRVKVYTLKIALILVIVAVYSATSSATQREREVAKTEQAAGQLADASGQSTTAAKEESVVASNRYALGWGIVLGVSLVILLVDPKRFAAVAALLPLLASSGCWRPFEPVKLETIGPSEMAFLLPFQGDARKQTSSENDAFIKENLVYTKQVKIPQQWVQKGYETFGPNGIWQDAALLIRVNMAPVTREWTADPNSGTSNKNEAVWVMTADQVEFSTGWTCTARIVDRDDAVKFLHNYPNGSLDKVMDAEVRAKLQSAFGLEVTDLPMETLRKQATPHIVNTVNEVIEFFKPRGITITNLGITGGFVYKDKTILDTMVKVFNAEQEKAIAAAETAAQEEHNKKVLLQATGLAESMLKTKEAEAAGIKLVAEAKMYELEQAKGQLESYIALKQIELQKELLARWDGAYPRNYMSTDASPSMLLQLPPLDSGKK